STSSWWTAIGYCCKASALRPRRKPASASANSSAQAMPAVTTGSCWPKAPPRRTPRPPSPRWRRRRRHVPRRRRARPDRSGRRGMADHDITTIDTGFQRPGFDAAYLVVEQGRGAFIDCGTNHSVPHMLEALRAKGLEVEAVDWLILTHVHLDHEGGAGALMKSLPNPRLVVHPRGARHMVDPARLVAGATAVYGEQEFARSYGEVLAVPEARVVVADDGHRVDLAGRMLECIDTPGHARHHLCVWDERSR